MKRHRHIGVYALVQKGAKMLFIKKARGPYTGQWDIPGGGLEFGEEAMETLIRELMEETGLELEKAELLDVFTNTASYKNEDNEDETVHHIGAAYRVEIKSGKKAKTDGDGEDSLGAKWIDISEINEKDFSPFANKMVKFLRK